MHTVTHLSHCIGVYLNGRQGRAGFEAVSHHALTLTASDFFDGLNLLWEQCGPAGQAFLKLCEPADVSGLDLLVSVQFAQSAEAQAAMLASLVTHAAPGPLGPRGPQLQVVLAESDSFNGAIALVWGFDDRAVLLPAHYVHHVDRGVLPVFVTHILTSVVHRDPRHQQGLVGSHDELL